jgi:hypothetical protein
MVTKKDYLIVIVIIKNNSIHISRKKREKKKEREKRRYIYQFLLQYGAIKHIAYVYIAIFI